MKPPKYIDNAKVILKNWETEQDAEYDSTDEAIKNLPEQYKNKIVSWKEYEKDIRNNQIRY